MTIPAQDALARLALAQPDVGAAGAPAPTGGADMMGGAATPTTPGTTGAPLGPNGQPQRSPGLFDSSFTLIIIMVLMLVLMMWSASRRQKRERTQRQTMMDSLAKGDVVVTIGGIKGTIVEDPTGKDDLVLMVDEIARTRIRFVKSAVSSVVRDNAAASTVEPKRDAKGTEAVASA